MIGTCKLQLGDGVQMAFQSSGVDSTKFIGSEGWLDVRRSSIAAEPKSLLAAKIGPNDVSPDQTPCIADTSSTRSSRVRRP